MVNFCMQVVSLSKEELLDRASKHFFSLGVGDGASSLCKANFKFGLAKIHYVQEKLGLVPNACFISTPDETISRNQTRWQSGYAYGGKLIWNDKPEKLIFVDTKPNACGMLVGGLEEKPKIESIIKNMNNLILEDTYIDDIKVGWDFKIGNHFVDIFKNDKSAIEKGLPPYTFIIHGSAPELKSATFKGVGMYHDKSKILKSMCESVKTPFGDVLILEGSNAQEYFNFFQYCKVFAAQKRIKAAEILFGSFTILSNPMHQGLKDYHELLLGAQYSRDPGEKLFPLALRSDLPAYLVKGLHSLTEEQITELGFEKRAKKYGLMNRLLNFNALPHGGGYALPYISKVQKIMEINGKRYFVCEQENEEATTVLTDMTETQFEYRGKKVVNRLESLELGTIEMKMYPRFVLKI